MVNDIECCSQCCYWRNEFSWINESCEREYAAECHRLPPITNGHETFFPKVKSDNWCGEFKRISPGDELGRKIKWMNKVIEGSEK